MSNTLKAILKNVLLNIPGLPEDQVKGQIIPALDDPKTEIKEEDLPEFFEKLAQNPQARQAFQAYLKVLLTKPRASQDKFETFFNKYILPNLKDNKQKPTRSRRK